jgi:hypothetical protein
MPQLADVYPCGVAAFLTLRDAARLAVAAPSLSRGQRSAAVRESAASGPLALPSGAWHTALRGLTGAPEAAAVDAACKAGGMPDPYVFADEDSENVESALRGVVAR